MCVVSAVGDDWMKRNDQWVDDFSKYTLLQPTNQQIMAKLEELGQNIGELKAEMVSLRKLLKAAKIYDEETGQPDCEIEEKVGIIKKLAEALGVDMEDVFGSDS